MNLSRARSLQIKLADQILAEDSHQSLFEVKRSLIFQNLYHGLFNSDR